MADNLDYSPGSGATVRSDEVGGVHYQVVKLDAGGDGASTPILAGNGTAASAIRVTLASDSTGIVALTTSTASIGKLAANSGVDIGDVDVLSVPADPFGVNADAASATGSISAKLRFIAGTGIPITGTVTVGSHAVTNAGTFAVQATVAAGATNIAKAEDVASADADVGVPAMAVRKATPANTSGTDGDYEMLQMSAGRLWTSTTVDAALPAGTNAIGKLAANSGVDIGDVDVLSIAAGDNNIGNVDIVTVPADPFGANADAASATGSISAKLRFIASTGIPITGTVTVGSHAVTNAGTFAVQSTLQAGSALVGKVGVDQTTPGTTNAVSVAQIGAGTVSTVATGVQKVGIADSGGTAITSATRGSERALSVQLVDASGVQITTFGGSGGTSSQDDAAFSLGAAASITVAGGIYIPGKDAVDSGDAGGLAMTQYRAMHTHLVDASGDPVSVGGGTQYTHDAALTPGTTVGTMAMGRASAAAPTAVSGDDAVLPWYLLNGAQATVLTAAGALVGGDATNGLDVDVTRLPALVAGTANIGDVDVLTVPADPFGANADAASATGSISAKLRFIAGTGIPVTGTVTVGTHAVTVASGGVASGAIASGAVASGAFASGALASGSVAAGAVAAGATSFVKLEDAAHGDGDAGVACYGVRQDTPANTSGTDGDYEAIKMSAGRVWTSAKVDTALPTGTNVIGKVGIDQTTPGTTNLVAATQSGTWTVQPGNTPNTTPWLVGHGKTLKSKTGSASATFTLVAAVASKKIKVYSLSLMTASTTAVTITFKDGAAGTAIGTYILQAISGTNFGVVDNVAVPSQLFETTANTLLEMSFSAAVSVTYNVRYWDDDAA